MNNLIHALLASILRAIIIFSGFVLSVSANAQSIRPMGRDEVELFSVLYRVYPNPEFGGEVPAINGRPEFDLRILAKNSASECDTRNFSPSCKGHLLYITVANSDIGGKKFGVVTSVAYGWKIAQIEHRAGKNPCVAISLTERVVEGVRGNYRWVQKPRNICISPDGIVPG
jgi:hypothetical protein